MTPVDTALVHALAMHHVEEMQKGRKSFPREWKHEMSDRLCAAIEQAIEAEVEGIENELPESYR